MSEGRATDAGPVALFVPDLTGGGAERMMVAIAAMLAGSYERVDLVLVRRVGPYLSEVPPSVRVVDLEARGVLASLPRLVAYLRQERPTAMISTLAYANVALVWARALAGARTRVILRESSTPSLVQRNRLDARGYFLPILMRTFYARADAVVAVSQGVAEDLRRYLGVPAEKIHVIHNPVVGDDLVQRAAQPLDDAWFDHGAPPVILSVGRLSPEKDYPTLLRAFARLRAIREARLVILGEGRERARLEELARDLGIAGDLRLPGFVADPYPYMSRAAAYVLSSQREGLPGALIQAMACGCPVISTNCPSGPSEVLADGRYGQLVPVADPSAMADAMLAALEDPPDPACAISRSRDFSASRSRRLYVDLVRGNESTNSAAEP